MALFVAGIATFAALYCTQPLLPLLSARFGVGAGSAALSVSLATLTLGVALFVFGPLSDARGRTRIMVFSLFGSGLLTLLTAFAPSWPALLVMRALLGLVVAGLPAVAVAYLRDEIHPSHVASATGLYIGGTALGGMSGRLVSGLVAQGVDSVWPADPAWGWRAAIAVIGLVSLGCAFTVRALLPASRRFVPRPISADDLLRRTGALLRSPVMWGLFWIGFAGMGAFVGVFNTMGYRLEAAPFHLGVGVASMVFVVYAFGSWSSARAGGVADARGPAPVIIAALLIALTGVLISLVDSLVAIALALALLTIGFFAAHGVASAWVSGQASRTGLGTGQAASLYLVCYYLGSSLAGWIAGQAWTRAAWPGVALVSAALLVSCVVVAIGLARVRVRR